MNGSDYINIVSNMIKEAYETQTEQIKAAAKALAETVEAKNNVFVFGCSHAGIIAEELFYRTGGLAVINPIFFPGMMLNTRPITMTSSLERLAGLGKTIFEKNSVKSGDLLILHSVSGRNAVPVEMALCAKENGVKTVCLTNLSYSRSVTPRHPCGKRLFEVCDIVIDNKGEPGDAAVRIEGLPEKTGPTSTAVGAAIMNALTVDAINVMIEDGFVPPILMSANLDGGDEHNDKIFAEYKDNIFYM